MNEKIRERMKEIAFLKKRYGTPRDERHLKVPVDDSYYSRF